MPSMSANYPCSFESCQGRNAEMKKNKSHFKSCRNLKAAEAEIDTKMNDFGEEMLRRANMLKLKKNFRERDHGRKSKS